MSPEPLEPPASDSVHLWRIALDGRPPAVLDGLSAVLSNAERERWEAMGPADGRRRFTVAHGALRYILARYLRVAPGDVRLTTGRWGKPEIDADGQPPAVRFSLSHVEDHALLAVTRSRATGVDIEQTRDDRFMRTVSARHFMPGEARWVAAAPADGRGAAFLRLWTRKEACVKAVGARLADGLRLPVAGRGRSLVVQAPVPDHQPSRCTCSVRVRDLRAPHGHAAAVALTGAAPFGVVHHHWQPEFTGLRNTEG